MNDDTAGRCGRARLQRAGVLAATVAGTALLAAACGSGNSSAAARSTTYQKALGYAQCMRSRGVPGWPDPNITLHGPAGFGPGSPQLKSAQRACRSLWPVGAS